MKRRKLMKPYLAGMVVLASVCLGTTAYAEEAVPSDGMIALEETVPDTDLSFTGEPVGIETEPVLDEDDVSDTPEMETDDSDDDQEPTEEVQDPDNPDETDSEENEKKVTLSETVLYQGDETKLEADGIFGENTENIHHETLIITIPQELATGQLTKPVFEDAEVSVLIDGEEVSSEDAVIDIGKKAEEIGIKVKPLGNVLTQVQKLVLTLTNMSEEESQTLIEYVIHRVFKDDSGEITLPETLTVTLKGTKPVMPPVDEPVVTPDPEPEYPEETDPVEDEEPSDEPVEEIEKDKEEERPQEKPVENIIEIVDNTGLNLIESVINILKPTKTCFESTQTDSEFNSESSFVVTKKYETASVEDIDEELKEQLNSISKDSADDDKGKDPVVWKEKKIGIHEEKNTGIPVLMTLLAVIAAAGVIFVPLAKRHKDNRREEDNGMK